MRTEKFEVYKDKSSPVRKWRWRLWSANSVDIIAASGQGYVDKADCLNGIRIVKESKDAPIEYTDVRKPRPVYIKPSTHQPSKAELEEEIDMPAMDDEKIRRTFFRPVRLIRSESS